MKHETIFQATPTRGSITVLWADLGPRPTRHRGKRDEGIRQKGTEAGTGIPSPHRIDSSHPHPMPSSLRGKRRRKAFRPDQEIEQYEDRVTRIWNTTCRGPALWNGGTDPTKRTNR